MERPLAPTIPTPDCARHEDRMEDKANRELTVDAIGAGHEKEWRHLWQQYLEFYETDLPEAVTAQTWQNILANDKVIGLGAIRSGRLIGFAIIIIHQATWSDRPTAYLEDLFVSSDERGQGAGRMLIDEVIGRARGCGWGSLYWHTRASNAVARRLYDSYCGADDFVRYRLTF